MPKDTVKWAQMTPREHDQLVAKTLGWKKLEVADGELYGEPLSVQLPMRARLVVPHYSTDIKQAWDIAEQVARSGGFDFSVRFAGGTWVATFDRGRFSAHSEHASTAPEAICKAVLNVIGNHVFA